MPPKSMRDALRATLQEVAGDQGPVYKREQQEFEGPREFCHLCWRMVPVDACTDEVCDDCHNDPD